MDFLENAVNKTKDVFDVACKKTGEVVNTGKVRLDIASLENKINKDFEALGRMYFEDIKDCYGEGSIFAIRDAIIEKQAKIEKLKEELNNQ